MLESIWFRVILLIFAIATICRSQCKAWRKDLCKEKMENEKNPKKFKDAKFKFELNTRIVNRIANISVGIKHKQGFGFFTAINKNKVLPKERSSLWLFLECHQKLSNFHLNYDIKSYNNKNNPSIECNFKSNYGDLFIISNIPDVNGGIYEITLKEDKENDNT